MQVADVPFSTASPYVGYSYSYPHKFAYRSFSKPVPLEQVWQHEDRSSLFLYVHVPFCEYRCGFCNLFTLANADEGLPAAYLRQLRVEAKATRNALPDAQFSRIAIGGGTPTFLSEQGLAELLEVIASTFDAAPRNVPVSCEASPATLTRGKAQLLREWGVDRLSLGVQTFDDAESRRLGRPQCVGEVHRAIAVAQEAGFPQLNLDLIYGVPGQSISAWLNSVEAAAQYEPAEIYLYPLYVREQTGLGKTSSAPGDNRVEAYRAGRQLLIDAGYEQVSLRMFRRPQVATEDTPVYCCQSDGMVGLGCGARSYTRDLHYSSEFAVERTGVQSIIASYLGRDRDAFRHASYGFQLDEEERRRRYVILSLLQIEGLDLERYSARFGSDLLCDLPSLTELIERDMASVADNRLLLTDRGIEMSDAIGPWLNSRRVLQLMEEFECR